MTLDEIVEEVRRWPQEQVTELVDRLASTMHTDEPVVEEAWKRETRQRVVKIDSGAGRGIPGDEVSARIRRIVGR